MCLLTQMDHKANNSRPIADVTDRRSDTANVKELWGHQSMDSFIRLKLRWKKGLLQLIDTIFDELNK
jgi:hypothetical protein